MTYQHAECVCCVQARLFYVLLTCVPFTDYKYHTVLVTVSKLVRLSYMFSCIAHECVSRAAFVVMQRAKASQLPKAVAGKETGCNWSMPKSLL